MLDSNYMNMHNYLSTIYSKQNKSDSASYHLNKFLHIYDKVSSIDKNQFKETYKISKENYFTKKINNLNQKNFHYSTILLSLIIVIFFISFFVYKNNKEKKIAKKRLDELILKFSKKNKNQNNLFLEKNLKDEKNKEIIQGLIKIERKLYFLKEEFNLYNAAKKIGTNTTYLSKVIKDHKKMNFSEYTNELRINYIIQILSTDKKIRSYTTQAIAEIGGYKNAKSFTRIFKNYTGITPYQFIEKINKELI